jgi:hypothetical protein
MPGGWFASPIALKAPGSTGEPSITIADNGTVWIASPHSSELMGFGGDHFWRSDTSGTRFEYLGNPDPFLGGADVDIGVDDTGRLWYTALATLKTCISVGTSMDGKTFLQDPTLCLVSNGDRPWIATAPGSRAYVVYGHGSGPWRLQVVAFDNVQGMPASRSTLYPLLRVPVPMADGPAGQGRIGKPVLDPQGRLFVPTSGIDGKLHVYRITDSGQPQGLSAEDFPVSPVHSPWNESFPSLTVDPKGDLFMVWGDKGDNQTTMAYVATSLDHGETWSAPRAVSRAPATIAFPAIVVGDAGRVGIAYYGTDAHGADPNKVRGNWSLYYVYSKNATLSGSAYTELQVTDGFVHAGAICNLGTLCTKADRQLLDFLSIAMGPDGGARIAYTASMPGDQGIHYSYQVEGPKLK